MKTKTLYIPTTTLNFNNILSSESISPKAFYEQRGFGYNRWSSIPENDMANAILLYDKPFALSRPDNGLEDHPLFIEIKADEDFPCVGDGVYYCDHTLYLSPWRARFIFLSDKDMISTEAMSESSIETKMVPLYKKRLVVNHSISGQAPSFTMPDVPLNEKAIDNDRWVNKMKGLLYGYYIGALLSATPESVDRMNTLQEIRNIFSSTLSSERRLPTPIQDERLGDLFNKMNYTSAVFKILKPLNDDDLKIMAASRELWQCGCLTKGSWIDKDNMLRLLTYSTTKHNEAFAWLEAEESRLKAEMRRQGNPLKVSDEEIITGDKRVTKISDKVLQSIRDRDVTMAWVNDILSSREYNGKIGTFNKALSDKLTFRAKDIYGSEWESSDVKRELNQMRRFIAGAEAEPTWTNGYISSMAAVLLKGDDWDKLLAFMRSKSMYDYRLAFAFYGELNGFANLTRDFTDVLLTADRYYVAGVIKEFNGQLLGDDLFFQDEPISEKIIENIDMLNLKPWNKPKEAIEAVRKTGELELAVQKPKAFMYIIDNVLGKGTRVYKALKKSGFENDTSKYSPEEFRAKIDSIVKPELDKLKGEKKQKCIEKIDKAIDLESRINDREAFMYILDNFLPSRGKAYKVIAKMLNGEIGGEKTMARAKEQSLFSANEYYDVREKMVKGDIDGKQSTIPFSDAEDSYGRSINGNYKNGDRSGQSVLLDHSWWRETADMIMDERARKQYLQDAEWFVRNHEDWYNDPKGVEKPGRYKDKEKDNSRVVNRFYHYMQNKRGGLNSTQKWLSDIYSRVPINKIITYLCQRYGVRDVMKA